MENHSYPRVGNLLAAGKCVSADVFACGHIVLNVAGLRLGFSREDFADFVATMALASENLHRRDCEISEWGLFL